jgi:hypothetical protein
MKYLGFIALLALITTLSIKPKSIEERVSIQIEESQALHDSAMNLLIELHEKNDSLIDIYFPKDGVGNN